MGADITSTLVVFKIALNKVNHTEYLLFSYLLLQNPSQISFKVKTLGDCGLNDHDQQCN